MYGSADDISEGEALSEWLECETVETLVEILQAQGTELPKKKVVYLKETPKVGDRIECKHCGKVFIKKSYQHKFCSLRCKDTFHNSHGDRAFRARWWNS